MNGQRNQWPSKHVPFISTYGEGMPSLHHASQHEAQHADVCHGSILAGCWTEDSEPTRPQQGQSESYSGQHIPTEAANCRVGSVQDSTVFTVGNTIGKFDTACGTTKDGCDPLTPASNLYWWQNEKFTYQQLSPVYPRQQPQTGISTFPYRQSSNGSANELIPDPCVAVMNEPWSPYSTLNGNQNPRCAKHTQVIAEQHASGATHPMFCRDGSNSAYPNHAGLGSTMSKTSSEGFLHPLQPSAPHFRMNSPAFSDPISLKAPLHAIHAPGPKLSPRHGRREYTERVSSSKTGRHRVGYVPHQGRYLAPHMQRRVSSTSSHTTEATSSSARSDQTSEILTCPEARCESKFSGKYRTGNQKRHMRVKHRDTPSSACDICGGTFARSDALLKHIRKQHPERAAEIPLVSRAEETGLRDEHGVHYR